MGTRSDAKLTVTVASGDVFCCAAGTKCGDFSLPPDITLAQFELSIVRCAVGWSLPRFLPTMPFLRLCPIGWRVFADCCLVRICCNQGVAGRAQR